MVKHTRVNLTVPKEIHDQMAQYKGQVNWSRVASLAFKEHLEKLRLEEIRAQQDEWALKMLERNGRHHQQ